MAKILGKKLRKQKNSIRDQLSTEVKLATRKGKFVSVAMGMLGRSYLLYVFGPKMTKDERNTALEFCAGALVRQHERIDVIYIKTHDHYDITITDHPMWETLYQPHRVVKLMLSKGMDPLSHKGLSLKIILDSLNMSVPQLKASIDQLHRYDVTRLSPTGHLWFKDGLEDFVRNTPDITLEYIVPSEVI